MKYKNKYMSFAIFIFIIMIVWSGFIIGFAIINSRQENYSDYLVATNLGIGGGGALFKPSISPFDSNEMLVIPDMGGIYITHDKGTSWQRRYLYGTVSCAKYDPNIEGTLYAGGTGLYRSSDNGDNFELIYPKPEEITGIGIYDAGGHQFLFTRNNDYPYNKHVRDIVIDPDDSNHIIILLYRQSEGTILESKDGGDSFEIIVDYSVNYITSTDIQKLFYKKESNEIYVFNAERIIGYNLETKEQVFENISELHYVEGTSVYDNGQTHFIIIENTENNNMTNTIIYYTNDFVNITDITDVVMSSRSNEFNHFTYGHNTFKYNFKYLSASSLNNIYVANVTSTETGLFPNTIHTIARYHDNKADYIFGHPFSELTSYSWGDGGATPIDIAASPNSDLEFVFTTLSGVYYCNDGGNIYPKQTTVVEGCYEDGDGRYVTNGIDEQTTYGVREDPFHPGVLLLLNTDLGLIRSENNGESWYLARTGIPSGWSGNIYDAHFDKIQENVVYSIWSSRHDVPYKIANETDRVTGGFAISYDGGITWDSNYSTGLPENSIPCKMSVIYNNNSLETTIYIATFNHGFYVSTDSGRTFEAINNGLEPVAYKEDSRYHYIFAYDIEVKDGHIFGLIAKNTVNSVTTDGKIYEYIDGTWQNIQLPENSKNPKDLYYKDGVLYITGEAKLKWDNKNGIIANPYGGGVLAYADGEFTQIFDESIFTTSVQIDSHGTMYISDVNGNIYRKESNKDVQIIYQQYHYISKHLELSDDEDRLYLASYGGGVLRLENLKSLYNHVHTGGLATCCSLAVCDVCHQEYGELNPNNHVLTTTHITNKKSATCAEEGYTGDTVFDCCNAIKLRGRTIEKLEHSFDSGVITKEATTEEDGEIKYTCIKCNTIIVEKIPRINSVKNNTVNNTINNTINNNINNTSNSINNNIINNTINNTLNNIVNNSINNTINNTVNNIISNNIKNEINNDNKNDDSNNKDTVRKVIINHDYIVYDDTNNGGTKTYVSGSGNSNNAISSRLPYTGDIISIIASVILAVSLFSNIILLLIKNVKNR